MSLPTPSSNQPYIEVSALEAGTIDLPLWLFVAGESKLPQSNICPSLSFLLRHSESKAQLVFDLGLRRDVQSYPPSVLKLIAQWMPVNIPQNVAESLSKGGVEPGDVETVVLSHLHFDQYVTALGPTPRKNM